MSNNKDIEIDYLRLRNIYEVKFLDLNRKCNFFNNGLDEAIKETFYIEEFGYSGSITRVDLIQKLHGYQTIFLYIGDVIKFIEEKYKNSKNEIYVNIYINFTINIEDVSLKAIRNSKTINLFNFTKYRNYKYTLKDGDREYCFQEGYFQISNIWISNIWKGETCVFPKNVYFPNEPDEKQKDINPSDVDKINPDYYKDCPIEIIDCIKSILTNEPNAFKGYLKGNIIKYISRENKKNGKEDLEKAKWYLNKLINEYKREHND